MLALTVCQPYATLIVDGEKLCENRGWAPGQQTLRCGGWLAIHAGKSRAWFEDDDDPKAHVFSAVLGVARYYGCWPAEFIRRRARTTVGADLGYPRPSLLRLPAVWDHIGDSQCWVFSEAWRFQAPIPCPGQLGLWRPSEDVQGKITEQVELIAAHDESFPRPLSNSTPKWRHPQ